MTGDKFTIHDHTQIVVEISSGFNRTLVQLDVTMVNFTNLWPNPLSSGNAENGRDVVTYLLVNG